MYSPFSSIYKTFLNAGLSVASFVKHAYSDQGYGDVASVIGDPVALVAAVYEGNMDVVFDWAMGVVTGRLAQEISLLSLPAKKLHFNASSATPELLKGPYMYNTAITMRESAPNVWKLVNTLLDARGNYQARLERSGLDLGEGDVLRWFREQVEPDLGEIGGQVPLEHGPDDGDSDLEDTGDVESHATRCEVQDMDPDIEHEPNDEPIPDSEPPGRPPLTKKQRRRLERDTALMVIKTVVCISILLQSTSQKCNFLQAILGLFFHSAGVPEKVIETLAHAGITVGLTTIHDMIKSLSLAAMDKLKRVVRTLHSSFAYDNFDILFKKSQPTVERSSLFVSATSATAIPLYDGGPLKLDLSALRCSEEMWNKNPLNPNPPRPLPPIAELHSTLWEMHDDPDSFPAAGGQLSPLEARLAYHVRDILIKHGSANGHLAEFKRANEDSLVPINCIPVHRTEQVPCRAMNIKESTPDGNIEVIETLLRQGGIGDPKDSKFEQGKDVDMTDTIILFHGDLLTVERQDSILATRSIEDTPKRRFQFVVPIPGLFHFLMAGADALWRTWLLPIESRTDDNSLYAHVGITRPDETAKITSKPGYRRTLEVIQQDITASMLDCWSIVTKEANSDWKTLGEFGESKPTWSQVVAYSEEIIRRFVAHTEELSDARRKDPSQRDAIFENQCLRNRDELLFLETYSAMNTGDIGRVEATFLNWIYLFRATGKHKYSSHLLKFYHNLQHVYPQEVSRIIRMNWLVNPTGKPGAFRGVDWLVERNNLYTKVIYGGQGSNYTLNRILTESILIEIFRESHLAVELGFHLKNRTVRHSPPDLTRTLKKLIAHFEEKTKPHIFTPGRSAGFNARDMVGIGMGITHEILHARSNQGDVEMYDGTELPMDAPELLVEPEDLL